MDRRRSPRVASNMPACLTVLSQPEQDYTVVVEEISGGGARIFTEAQLAVNTPVKLMVDDDLFLGEVCHRQTAPGGFQVGLKLDSALTGVSALRALMKALMEGSSDTRSDRSHAVQSDDNRDH